MELIKELSEQSELTKYKLSDFVKENLTKDETKPFADSKEFFDAVTSFLVLSFISFEEINFPVTLFEKNSQPKNFPAHVQWIEHTRKLKEKMKEIIFKKVELMPNKPIVARYKDKIKLTDKEFLLLSCLVLSSIGFSIPNAMRFYSLEGLSTMGLFGDMTPFELINFVSPTRGHMKDRMFKNGIESYGYMRMEPQFVAALFDQDLSEEQMLSLQGTNLGAVFEERKKEKEDEKKNGEEKIELAKNELEKIDQEKNELEKIDQTKNELDEMDISQWISEEKIHEKKTVKTKNIEQTAQDKQAQEQQSFPDLKPYANDFEYLEDRFEMYANKLNLIQEKENESQTFYIDSVFHSQALVREFSAKDHSLRTKCEQRLKLTEKNGEWIPRMERLAESRKLTEFEKNVVLFLIGIKTSQKMLAVLNWRQVTVEMLLKMFCKNLKEQVMNRKYFYKSGSLVRDRIIQFSGSMLESSLNSMEVFVDRRMVDFVLGLDTEMEELIEGSHLYTSTVKMDHVVLREEDKRLVLKTVTNYDHFAKCRKRLGLDDAIANSGGLVLLFYGESGTGKTMMANALGNELGRKIMLINFPTLGKNTAGEIIQYIFREANLHNALLFFDECEGIFESRQKGQYNVNLLLTEIEKFDGIIVLATNRAFDLDEAMHRRIALALEFKKPDPLLRQQIWDAHLPKSIRYDSSVDLKALALKFELTGGFIKNAVLSALSIAVSRDGLENVTITQEDLERGAKLQLRAKLRMTDFHRRIVPQRGLSTLVLPPKTLQLVREIIDAEKSRLVLDSWGFDTSIGFQAGSTVLLCGPPGTGKTLATEAIAYEIGRPLKVINAAELVSKYVGQTSKNIDLLFTEAKNNDSVLVFDEAEGLFGTRHSAQKSSTDRYANIDVGLLLYHMEKFNGIVILCSNLVSAIDPAFFRRMRFVVDFPMPDQGLREILWKKLIPDSAPVLSDSIQFKLLASSFEFSGGNIHNSIIRAASKVALRPRDSQTITTDDLFQAAQKELEKISKNIDKNQSYIK